MHPKLSKFYTEKNGKEKLSHSLTTKVLDTTITLQRLKKFSQIQKDEMVTLILIQL